MSRDSPQACTRRGLRSPPLRFPSGLPFRPWFAAELERISPGSAHCTVRPTRGARLGSRAPGSQQPAGLPESPGVSLPPEDEPVGPEVRPGATPRPHLPAAAPGKSFPRRLPAAALAAGSSFHMAPAPRSPATRHANRGCPACAATELQRRGLRDVRAPRTPPSSSEAREGGARAPPAPRATCWSPGAVQRGKCPVKRV